MTGQTAVIIVRQREWHHLPRTGGAWHFTYTAHVADLLMETTPEDKRCLPLRMTSYSLAAIRAYLKHVAPQYPVYETWKRGV